MQTEQTRNVVHAWLEALNNRQHALVLQASAADTEVAGPRGPVRGQEGLRAWLNNT